VARGITQRARKNIASADRLARKFTGDSFNNFAAKLGIGSDNLSTSNTYGFNPITRVRTLLEWMYRGSWIVGKAIDCIPQDMMKRGITLTGDNDPDEIKRVMRRLRTVWGRVTESLRWGRLYGGCLGVIMIKGQDPAQPLRLETVRKGSFLNLMVLDRWMVEPSLEDLVTDIGSDDLGLPRFYRVTADAPALPRMSIHHTRVIRFLGVDLPYWQYIAENLWGMSVLERLYDRLTAFDSATTGAAQLMYRADIRTYYVENLRKIIAAGGDAFNALVEQMKHNSVWQSNERMFVIDALDKFERQQYSFTGIPETILQFGMQISGALDIPLVRLFGQSPSGLNSTGESDLITYYDGIVQRQEADLRPQLERFLPVVVASEGYKWDPDEHDFEFNPLLTLTDEQKEQIAERRTNRTLAAEEAGLVSPRTALTELKAGAARTGAWTSISDEDIEAADDATPPSAAEMMSQQQEAQEAQEGRTQEQHEAQMQEQPGDVVGGGTVKPSQAKAVKPRVTLQ
jgi:phage-related protein (TIGR01555 family)